MKCIYKNNISELNKLAEDIKIFGRKYAIAYEDLYNINLCIDEVLTNIIYYGYEDHQPHSIEIELIALQNSIEIIIRDNGKPFNPLREAIPPKINVCLEERQEGGLGIYFVKQLMDALSYHREGDYNILKMTKYHTSK